MEYETDTEERLKELCELSRLYDLYGALLSDHSRIIFEDYIFNNYSLAEIAEEVGLTRQGVRDIVVRYSKKLHEYEEKLGFLKKLDNIESSVGKLGDMIETESFNKDEMLGLIRRISNEL